jgi:hypothetical protein
MAANSKKPKPSASSARSRSQLRAPDKCSRCGSGRLVAIAYGYPGPEMMAAAERGEVLLGGCVVSAEMPLAGCADCSWPRSESRQAIGEAEADRHRQTEQDDGEDDTYVRRLVGEIGRLSGGHMNDQHPVV